MKNRIVLPKLAAFDVARVEAIKVEYARLMAAGKMERADALLQELRDMGLDVRIRRHGVGVIETAPGRVMSPRDEARDLCDQRTRAWNAGRFAEAERMLSRIRELGYDVRHVSRGVVQFYERGDRPNEDLGTYQ